MTAPGGGMTAPGASDAATWDAYVAHASLATYLQVSAWARVKAANGWRSRRVVAARSDGSGSIGAQILLRRPVGIPWTFGYAPRGPLTERWDAEAVEAWTSALRGERWGERVSHVRIDPELEAGGPSDPGGTLGVAFGAAGWRPAPAVQPRITRIVDLRPDEAALWSDLRNKWRQYVRLAERAGLRVVDGDGSRLDEFHAVMRETAARAGTRIRARSAYADVWEAFSPSGGARLLFADRADGSAEAVLFLLRVGDRVVEPYGGMTESGARDRANYLLKWEAMRSSRAAGATSYDMWGLVHPGIRQFKAGFGGREVELIGAFDLPLDRFGRAAYRLAETIRDRARRPRP
ncbi:MAG: lipid II:glycine glycyltransferase FemX [Candidatus Limnocylindrales bacterium]